MLIQIFQRGARQMYESGLIKARRYSSLLTQVCQLRNLNSNFKTIYVRSSAVERCVASAVNFLAGFFPLPFPQSLINIKPLEQDEVGPIYYLIFRIFTSTF